MFPNWVKLARLGKIYTYTMYVQNTSYIQQTCIYRDGLSTEHKGSAFTHKAYNNMGY